MSFEIRNLRKTQKFQTKLDKSVQEYNNNCLTRFEQHMQLLRTVMAMVKKNTRDWQILCSMEGQATVLHTFTDKQVSLITDIYLRSTHS